MASPAFPDDNPFPPDLEHRLHRLAAEAAAMRVDDGELPGPAELLGYVDAVGFLQSTGQLPLPSW